MTRLFVSFVSGLLFALGLGIAGMTDANRVVAFLDVLGDWDPALMLVMVGAMGTFAVPAHLALRRGRPLLDDRFHLAPFQGVDARLVVGSALFGVGWGMSGYCPGPAIVAAGAGMEQALVFTLGMAGGMAGWHAVLAFSRQEPSTEAMEAPSIEPSGLLPSLPP